MLLIDNLLEMRKYMPPPTVQALKKIDEGLEGSNLKVETARSGVPTLRMDGENGPVFLLSSYDPVREAESLIGQMDEEEVSRAEHVFFYGIGLGYHIEAFCRKFPTKSYSIYEPNPEILCHFLSTRLLSKFPLKMMQNFYVEFSPAEMEQNVYLFFWNKLGVEKLAFVTLPCYERLFPEQFCRFTAAFKEKLADAASGKATQLNFQKRWTINSMLNFRENLHNRSIFDCNPECFENRPAFLVAAGPSLSYEFDNLRRVRAEGLGYVFTVGSAIKALLANDIHPHAAATMDPGPANLLVFEDVINQGITDIPLIYGTSVGYETLVRYPGPKLYMIMDRDRTTPYYFPADEANVLDIVGDAPTIAITTLQLLIKLRFNPIILVGQDFAMHGKNRYAEGVKYSYRPTDHKATEGELRDNIEVDDVNGNKVPTLQAFVYSRKVMESLIAQARTAGQRTFINTTRYGARIEGADFIPFDTLWGRCLKEPVVEQDWHLPARQRRLDLESLLKKDDRMKADRDALVRLLDEAMEQLIRIDAIKEYKKGKEINEELIRFDGIFARVASNRFYQCFLEAMVYLELSAINNRLLRIRKEKNYRVRAQLTVSAFGLLLYQIRKDLAAYALPIYSQVHHAIQEYASARSEEGHPC